ncbi:MAG: hypothetical protein J6R08_00240 [Opitutales bacterium]|nr:hypothetical protein [Opitutales bacterium]
MNWIKITHQDLEIVLNKSQLEILKAAEFASPGRDIAESVISMAVSRIRAEISAGQANFLDPDHSRIPPELKECALSLALEALQARLPDMPMPSSISKRADLARETLARVAEGELPVSQPLYGIKTARKKGVSLLKSRRQNFSSKTMEGL